MLKYDVTSYIRNHVMITLSLTIINNSDDSIVFFFFFFWKIFAQKEIYARSCACVHACGDQGRNHDGGDGGWGGRRVKRIYLSVVVLTFD